MSSPRFAGKLAIQQRLLTPYRASFFDMLAGFCDGGVKVCAGLPRREESVAVTNELRHAQLTRVTNVHLFSSRYYLCYQRGLLPWLAANSPDALIVEANPRYLSTLAVVRWMKSRGRPVLGWGLGAPGSTSSQNILMKAISGLMHASRASFLRHFDALITYSRKGAREYEALGFPKQKIFIAPNAAAARPTQPMPVREVSAGKKLKVLFVGRLQARKRLDLLLEACAGLPNALQPHLKIVGDGPERKPLERLANSIFPSAEFLGSKFGPDLAACFSSADLFVLPGTGGLAVQEAMSFGLPIIMGVGDGTNDELVRPENGWQIPADDVTALINCLSTALSDPARLSVMGAESYRIACDEVNLERMVAVFIEALNSLG